MYETAYFLIAFQYNAFLNILTFAYPITKTMAYKYNLSLHLFNFYV